MRKKIQIWCFLIWICLFLTWCLGSSVPKDKMLNFKQWQEQKSGYIFESFEQKVKKTDKTSMLDFKWQSLLLIWCSVSNVDCVKFIPVFEQEIYNKYVLNKKNNKENSRSDKNFSVLLENYWDYFNTSIPQSNKWNFDVSSFFNSWCNLQPSWVLLKDNNVVVKSCGWQKSIQDLQNEIEKLLN